MKRKSLNNDAISEGTGAEVAYTAPDADAAEGDKDADKSIKSDDNAISTQYLKYLKKYPLLTKKQEYELALKVGEGDEKARDLMIKSNLGLVISVAKKFLGRGLSFEDIIMEGNLGLIKAVEKFKPKKGFRFSTYAIWWIRQTIERGILNSGRVVRLPIHISENIYKYARAVKEITSEIQREPKLNEIADRMGIKESKLEKVMSLVGNIYSLDAPYSGNEDEENSANSFANLIKTDESADSAYDTLDKIETLNLLNKWLIKLPEIERKVIILRYGLNYEKPRTLNEVGNIFGLTKERIRQIEVKALKKLKLMATEAGLISLKSSDDR